LQVINGAQLAYEQINRASRLAGCVAVVTGASSGIGRAIAVALSRQGVQVCVVGRNPDTLAETVAAARQFSQVTSFQIDLTGQENLQPLLQYLEGEAGRLDMLIHSAGVIHQDLMERARIEDFDLQYAINVRAPYLVTQRLLPLLTTARGQIVFINSSVGLAAKRPEVGQYSATKHALKAIADSLREEVNPKGIRVLTVYLGRTATPMQEALSRQEGRPYHPEALVQPEDVASVVVQALMLPPTAEVTDISIRPMIKSS
jgi:NAD(P)-dependent dehydrogenase (short-subunit alcohol dehydrogenase family)